MKLLVQPDDSVEPVLKAIDGARVSLDLYIFRLAYPKVEEALANAVARGVTVRTLIAHTNSGGEEGLRKLESRLLGLGATVSRTDEDLLRYHGKMMIVDQATLYVLGYNFTRRDIDKSRSLGLATRENDLVAEASRLFEADFDRKIYTPGHDRFIVSPLNARAALVAFIEASRHELMIYDSRLTDNMVQRVIEKRALAGVEIRVLGKLEKKLQGVVVEPYPGDRLHVRAMVRDGRYAFVGSQSLRRAELDRRREIGVVIDEKRTAREIAEIFEADWAETRSGKRAGSAKSARRRVAARAER
jgi:phosphatidylserine/phosphatidylglycerophosphate/cardiolipin synthase-like enzyme